jgi:hypothetical protein
MHTITFYPIGNADCCLIELENGQNLLFDYAHCKEFENPEDLRIDLKTEIADKMQTKNKDYLDIVVFTHSDDDHIRDFSSIFYLEHAKKYQGEDRIKINELWVPANVICESNLHDEAKILQAEARYRLKNKSGIKVFSRSTMLNKWFEGEGLDIKNYSEFLIDAGKIVPNFNLLDDNFEVFVHSLFGKRIDGEIIDRNTGSIVVHCVFSKSGKETKLILSADTPYENWIDIVNITKYHKREERLNWDVIKLPHHCSYLSLSSEKGKEKTEPVEEVKWLYEQGNTGAKIISTSDPIPTDDTDQPPHRQAANYYKEVLAAIKGEFIVTMEFPKKSKPEPLIINIDDSGATTIKRNLGAVGIISHQPTRRAG